MNDQKIASHSDVEKFKALFMLAGFTVKNTHELTNRYWPDNDHYAELRRNNPWLLVLTTDGPIVIGWRKRVISISWHDCDVRGYVTEDEVTKDEEMVHAYSYVKALEYLTELRRLCSNLIVKETTGA